MLRITRETDYGLLLLTRLAAADGLQTARDLSESTRIPLPMVSKILKSLTRSALLESHRGVKGGYLLARPPAELTVGEIIRVLDGPIALTECVDPDSDCAHLSLCPLHGNWNRINRAIEDTLDSISLAELARPEAVAPKRSAEEPGVDRRRKARAPGPRGGSETAKIQG